ncbi:hypothetical protein MJ585_23235 [Klebsiella pneumoniae]|nr:hypothetical protein MJ585_23235 [Klebsiella pneumoniae]
MTTMPEERLRKVNAELEQPDVWNERTRQALGKERSSTEAIVEYPGSDAEGWKTLPTQRIWP